MTPLLFCFFPTSQVLPPLLNFRVKDFVLGHLLFTFCTPLVSDPIQTQALNIVQRLNISTIYLQPCPHPWIWTCMANSLFNTSTWMSNEPWQPAPPSSFPPQLTVPSPPDAQARTLRVILDSSLSLIQSIWSLSQTCWLYLQSISELPLLPMITICPTSVQATNISHQEQKSPKWYSPLILLQPSLHTMAKEKTFKCKWDHVLPSKQIPLTIRRKFRLLTIRLTHSFCDSQPCLPLDLLVGKLK